MNKKLARLVLAVQRDIARNRALAGTTQSYAQVTTAMLLVEYWHSTPRASEMHDLLEAWERDCDYASAVALVAWLMEQ